MNLTIVKLLLLLGALAPQTDSKPHQHLDIPKGMRHYFVGFLVPGEKWAQTPPKEELDQLMQKHLAYIRSQAEAGKYALAGPFLDNGRIRGILIINAASAEEATQIVSGDPMVRSGRMSSEIHPAMLADLSCVLMEYEKNAGK
ncbi:MAG: YciI family protein [Bryobacteraceae bacterium]